MIFCLLGFTPFYPLPLSIGRTNRMQQRRHGIHGYVCVMISHMSVNHLDNRPPIACLVRYGLARSTDSVLQGSNQVISGSFGLIWGLILGAGVVSGCSGCWQPPVLRMLLARRPLFVAGCWRETTSTWCSLEALTTWQLASSKPVRESLWVILYTTRRLSYFNLLHLIGVNLPLHLMLGF